MAMGLQSKSINMKIRSFPIIAILVLNVTVSFSQGRFSAYYTNLNSGESWESDFRAGDHADIVVQLSEGKFYFGGRGKEF